MLPRNTKIINPIPTNRFVIVSKDKPKLNSRQIQFSDSFETQMKNHQTTPKLLVFKYIKNKQILKYSVEIPF